MKIRIKDNSVRIRLNKLEVENFGKEGYIESTIAFVSNTLTYAIETHSDKYGHELSVDFMNGIITMYIPEKMAKDWVETDVIGFETKLALDNEETLFLLLEKDFKCLDITTEDQSDNYENPLAFMKN